MTTTTKLDKAKLAAITRDLTHALEAIKVNHGLKSLTVGRSTYDPNAGLFTTKVEGMAAGGIDKDQRNYDEMRQMTKHWPERGATFVKAGRDLTIYGATRGGKIIVTDSHGRQLVMKYETFSAHFPWPDSAFENAVVAAPATIPARVRG